MNDDEKWQLFALADQILAVGRLIRSSPYVSAEMCAPIESAVMRYIDQNPGTTAQAAARATLLPTSNFSRVLRGLERKGLVRREADPDDGRRARLFHTELARQNLHDLRDAWSRTLQGAITDPAAIDSVSATLRQIEDTLIARREAEPLRSPTERA